MKKNIILSAIFILLSIFVQAKNTQKSDKDKETADFLLPDGYVNINYNLGFGLGDMHDFISKSSYRGFSLDARKFISDKITIGAYMGWTGFYEKFDRTTYKFNSGTITGVGATTYYNFTLGMNAHYYFKPEAKIKPFVGVNVGPVYQTIQRQMALYYIQDKSWQFMFAPEVGVFVPFGPETNMGVTTGVRYNLIGYQNSNYGFNNGISYLQWFIALTFEN